MRLPARRRVFVPQRPVFAFEDASSHPRDPRGALPDRPQVRRSITHQPFAKHVVHNTHAQWACATQSHSHLPFAAQLFEPRRSMFKSACRADHRRADRHRADHRADRRRANCGRVDRRRADRSITSFALSTTCILASDCTHAALQHRTLFPPITSLQHAVSTLFTLLDVSCSHAAGPASPHESSARNS